MTIGAADRGAKSKKRQKNCKSAAVSLLETPFIDLPKEIRDAFFYGTDRRLTFVQGTYRYESEWKGAIRAMRERLENPPSEKIKASLEELVFTDYLSRMSWNAAQTLNRWL